VPRFRAAWAHDHPVSDPEFHASVAEVRRAASSLADARARSSRTVAALTDRWRGAAADEFGEAWEEWLEASAWVASSLAGLADALAAYLGDITTRDSAAGSSLDG
jgi:WXG100 family type VII secretion target